MNKKIKILHIQVLPKLSGVQRVSLEIMKGLPNDQYDKWVLFSNHTDVGNKEQCQEEFEKAGVKVIFSSKIKRAINFSDITATIEIYRLCRREKFDIVHTHSTKPGIIGRIAATLARTPYVIHTIHGLAFHKYLCFPTWIFYWTCEMFASLFCNKIILVNHYYRKYFKWCSHKVFTIYNGIDFSSLSNNIQSNTKDSFPKILFVGRLDKQKDPLTLLKAAKIVINKYPDAKFTLVGDGIMYNKCQDFIQTNCLTQNINLAGWQKDVASYYSSHNIFAMSSIYEAFGLIFVEAAHYKLPVVTTNVEGIPEVVLDGKTGLLCNPRNPTDLAKNILSLIYNPELKISLGQYGYIRAHEMFSNTRMVKEYINIYKNIL